MFPSHFCFLEVKSTVLPSEGSKSLTTFWKRRTKMAKSNEPRFWFKNGARLKDKVEKKMTKNIKEFTKELINNSTKFN